MRWRRTPAPVLPELTDDDATRMRDYVDKASAPSTRRAYAADCRAFNAWCAARGLGTLPAAPATVAAFTAAAFTAAEADAGLTRATIGRRLAAIVYAHRVAGVVAPGTQAGSVLVETTLRGIRRDKRGDGTNQKRAADGDVLRDILREIDGDSLRRRATAACSASAWGGAFRRSEIVAIELDHVTIVPPGSRS